MSDALDRLCDAYGVVHAYADIWGRPHEATADAKRALLAAMGVAADSDAAAEASLQALARAQWQRPLAPVEVVRAADRPWRIAVTLPASEDRAPLRWRVRLEAGGELSEAFSPDALEARGRASLDGREYVRRELALDLALEPGYHRLVIERGDDVVGETSLIVAPERCYIPPAMQGERRLWGFAAQLYGIRSGRNWGIGDLSDLRHLVEFCAESGASSVLINPLHALFPDDPEHASPYSPSCRDGFNPLYLDVEAIADFAECDEARAQVFAPAFQARLRALRAADEVDYAGVAELKWQILELLHGHFREHHLGRRTERARAFRAFQAERGEGLRAQALFEALQAHFRAEDAAAWGWPVWPEAYRDPDAPGVAAFAEAHPERVEYFEYLQWQAATQLAAAGTRSWELGLGVGVMLDLAVGVAEGGAATWRRRELYALDARTGAPPDELNRRGQDWGLPPWIPHRLREAAYEPFIELLRANMRDAGALRLDHVMGLRRLFWSVRGLPVAEGSYVAYPLADLLGILALESQRNRCLVVGEDLGTVLGEVQQVLQQANVLSTRLLYFEREDSGRMQAPRAYPVTAMASVTTHDLPPLAGYWQGLDIELRDRLDLFPDDEAKAQQIVARAEDRAQLLLALEREGVLPAGSSLHLAGFPEMTAELAAAVYAYLARSPCRLLLVQMEDGLGVSAQPNLPGVTAPAYPCWRLKLPLNLEEWRGSAWLQGIVQALQRERPVVEVAGPAVGAGEQGVSLSIPRATYRLQMHRDFNLRQATALLPYLDELGVSHCYLSPLLRARPGSRHGYDITDHSSLNPEIASAEDVEQFAAALKRRGMGHIMDMVPNHMGVMGADNGWWLDVLENGPASRFAGYFDIDWYAVAADLPGRVLLPVLGDHYGAVLEQGALRLDFDAEQGAFSVFYFEHRFPIDPREYPRILGEGMARLQERLGAAHAVAQNFQSLVTSFGHLPARDSTDPEAVAERARDKEVHKRHLAALYAESADVAQFIEENVAAFNGMGADTGRFDLLHALLQAQAYRLAYWRVASDEINYRRFFDINDLAALRMDNPEVFANTHRLVRELLVRGYVNGLRVDHPDGLYAPQQYFERLQAMASALQRPGAADADAEAKPLYLVVEKILAAHEHLPDAWPVHGTTGYDFGVSCGGLFVDARADARFTRVYEGFIRARPDIDEMIRANKRLIMETSLAGELQVLAIQLARIAKEDRRTCDFTFNGLRGALAEVVASFPVYRTYVAGCASAPEDVRYVDWAVGVARKRSKAADTSIFDFVHDVLLARQGQGRENGYRAAVCAFAMKFQQFSSPVMAKALEDTTFYQYNRLLSLNEVGGDPQRFGVSPAAFHHENQARARRWPHAMLATSTHDSKRSEDVRARLNALSEMPDAWRRALSRWHRFNRGKARRVDDGEAPCRNDEYLLYQTLLGLWPFEAPDAAGLARLGERVEAYMIKAVREAKVHSSWVNPNAAYEDAVRGFVRALLTPDAGNPFLLDLVAFHAGLARLGAFNSLAQLLLKLTSPGVPDIYQGNEMWAFSLVDPDNRRAVDFEARRSALREIREAHDREGAAALARRLLDTLQDGRIKLYLTWKALACRREREALFAHGDYLPLRVHGHHADHVCAFMRRHGGETLLVAVPRLLGAFTQDVLPLGRAVWGDTWIELAGECPPVQWINVLTGEALRSQASDAVLGLGLSRLFRTLPYALLVADASAPPADSA